MYKNKFYNVYSFIDKDQLNRQPAAHQPFVSSSTKPNGDDRHCLLYGLGSEHRSPKKELSYCKFEHQAALEYGYPVTGRLENSLYQTTAGCCLPIALQFVIHNWTIAMSWLKLTDYKPPSLGRLVHKKYHKFIKLKYQFSSGLWDAIPVANISGNAT